MGKIIRSNGVNEQVQPVNHKDYKLDELQEICGGYVEPIELDDKRTMWVNEMGKVIGLPYNDEATTIAIESGAISSEDFILGDVLICETDEVY